MWVRVRVRSVLSGWVWVIELLETLRLGNLITRLDPPTASRTDLVRNVVQQVKNSLVVNFQITCLNLSRASSDRHKARACVWWGGVDGGCDCAQ